jgi:hypothetical protein
MSSLFFLRKHASPTVATLSIIGVATSAVGGCSSDENAKPNNVVITSTGGKQTDGGGKTGGTSGASGTSGAGGTSGTGGGSSDAGGAGGSVGDSGSGGTAGDSGSGGAAGGTTDAGCQTTTGPNGCINCPKTTDEFLHQCAATGVQCSAFNNARVLLLADPLPPVP